MQPLRDYQHRQVASGRQEKQINLLPLGQSWGSRLNQELYALGRRRDSQIFLELDKEKLKPELLGLPRVAGVSLFNALAGRKLT